MQGPVRPLGCSASLWCTCMSPAAYLCQQPTACSQLVAAEHWNSSARAPLHILLGSAMLLSCTAGLHQLPEPCSSPVQQPTVSQPALSKMASALTLLCLLAVLRVLNTVGTQHEIVELQFVQLGKSLAL